MTSRPHIPLRTKLAAALCQMLRPDESGQLAPVIPYERAKTMTEAEILSLWNWDHYPIPKALGGPDVHHNLVPRPVAEHAEKTAKVDIPAIAKTKRNERKHAEFCRDVLAKPAGHKRPTSSRWPSRKFNTKRAERAREG